MKEKDEDFNILNVVTTSAKPAHILFSTPPSFLFLDFVQKFKKKKKKKGK